MPLNWIQRLFSGSKTEPRAAQENCAGVTPKSDIVPLVRTDAEQTHYKQWLQTRAYSRWIEFFEAQFKNYNCQCKLAPCDNRLLFHVTKCMRGFTLHFDEKQHNKTDFQHLLHYCADAFLAIGYTIHAADVRTYRCKTENKENIERYYLKPPTNRSEHGKIRQVFGNITLTLHKKGNEPLFLQCRAAHFRDMDTFEPPEPLSALIECVTTVTRTPQATPHTSFQ